MAAVISPAERVMNLILALVNARRRYTRADLRALVAGYEECESDEAFARMFERDKAMLRDLGIPLVTIGSDHADEVGYLVDQTRLRLAELDLTPAERGVLNLAARFWRNQPVATDAVAGASKLSATSASAEETDILTGIEPALASATAHIRPLLDAITARQEVEFTYRSAAAGTRSKRRVQPWRLYAKGAWYLLAYDTARHDTRTFRLSRIKGRVSVKATVGAFPEPTTEQVEAARRLQPRTAQIAVLPGRAHALRARAHLIERDLVAEQERDVLELEFVDTYDLATEIVAFADAVLVMEPVELRDLVVTLLEAATKLVPHG